MYNSTLQSYIFRTLIFLLLILTSCNSTKKEGALEPAKAEKDKTEFVRGSEIKIQEIDSLTIDNLRVLAKVWGFLKYYHPAIANGDYNWDYELFRIMPHILKSETVDDRNKVLNNWVKSLGEVEKNDTPINLDTVKTRIYPDLAWTVDKTSLGEDLTKQLVLVKNAKRTGKHYYIEFFSETDNPNFLNENSYYRFRYPDVGYRLLALFRYWNIIEYYFPYKYLIDGDWNDILTEFIPLFINAKLELGYVLTVQKLVARINDSHALIQGNKKLDAYIGKNGAPAEITFIENKAVVTHIYKGYADKTPLKIGDVVLSINNTSVNDIIKKKTTYISASNNSALLRDIAAELLRSNNKKLRMTYLRDNKTMKDSIVYYPRKDLPIRNIYQRYQSLVKTLDNDITYIYLGTTKKSSIPREITSKGLIIDLRCYPSLDAISGFTEFDQLYYREEAYAKETKGSIKYPGLFSYKPTSEIGDDNPTYYKGKIVILVNELSQSLAEVTAMKYKCAPNATIIGSQTAGADGFISRLVLPGAILTRITGTGIYYPDLGETQRIGIVPDIEVKPTIRGIKQSRDEVLEKAIEIIHQK